MSRTFALYFCLGISFLGLFVFQPACSNGGSTSDGPDWRREFLVELGEGHIVPLYEALSESARELDIVTTGFCEQLEEPSFQAVRDRWHETRGLLKRAEVFAFGPHKEYPWRVGPKLDLWPVRPDEIEETLLERPWAETDDLSLTTGFSRGLPAMEYLLYSLGPSGEQAFDRLTSDSQACVYLTLLAKDIAANARTFFEAWSPQGDNYLQELTLAGAGSLVFSEASMALSEVINRLGFTVENMRELKLAKAAGISTPATDYTLLESYLSERSLVDLKDTLRGVKDVYEGTYIASSGGGVRALISAEKGEIDLEVTDAFREVEAAMDAFEMPLKQAIDQDPTRVRALYDSLTTLLRVFQVDVNQHLGVVLTFNDNDGD